MEDFGVLSNRQREQQPPFEERGLFPSALSIFLRLLLQIGQEAYGVVVPAVLAQEEVAVKGGIGGAHFSAHLA